MINDRRMITLLAISIVAIVAKARFSSEDFEKNDLSTFIGMPQATEADLIEKIYYDLDPIVKVAQKAQTFYGALLHYVTLGNEQFADLYDATFADETEKTIETKLEKEAEKFITTHNLLGDDLSEANVKSALASLDALFITGINLVIKKFNNDLYKSENNLALLNPSYNIFQSINTKIQVKAQSAFSAKNNQYVVNYNIFIEDFHKRSKESIEKFDSRNKAAARIYNFVFRFERNCAIAVSECSNKTVFVEGNDEPYKQLGIKLFSCFALTNALEVDRPPLDKSQIIMNYRKSIIKEFISDKYGIFASIIEPVVMDTSDDKYKAYLNNIIYSFYTNHYLNVKFEEIGDYVEQFIKYSYELIPMESIIFLFQATNTYYNNLDFIKYSFDKVLDYLSKAAIDSKLPFDHQFDAYLNLIMDKVPEEHSLYFNVLKLINGIVNEYTLNTDFEIIKLIDIEENKIIDISPLAESFTDILKEIIKRNKLSMDYVQLLSQPDFKRKWFMGIVTSKKTSETVKTKITINETLNIKHFGGSIDAKQFNMPGQVQNDDGFDNQNNNGAGKKKYNQKKGKNNVNGNVEPEYIPVAKDSPYKINTDKPLKNIIVHTSEPLDMKVYEFLETPKLVDRIRDGEKPEGIDSIIYVQVITAGSDCMEELIRKRIAEIRNQL